MLSRLLEHLQTDRVAFLNPSLNPETGETLSTLYGTGEWGTTFDLFVDSDDEQMLGEQSDTGDKNGVASA